MSPFWFFILIISKVFLTNLFTPLICMLVTFWILGFLFFQWFLCFIFWSLYTSLLILIMKMMRLPPNKFISCLFCIFLNLRFISHLFIITLFSWFLFFIINFFSLWLALFLKRMLRFRFVWICSLFCWILFSIISALLVWNLFIITKLIRFVIKRLMIRFLLRMIFRS